MNKDVTWNGFVVETEYVIDFIAVPRHSLWLMFWGIIVTYTQLLKVKLLAGEEPTGFWYVVLCGLQYGLLIGFGGEFPLAAVCLHIAWVPGSLSNHPTHHSVHIYIYTPYTTIMNHREYLYVQYISLYIYIHNIVLFDYLYGMDTITQRLFNDAGLKYYDCCICGGQMSWTPSHKTLGDVKLFAGALPLYWFVDAIYELVFGWCIVDAIVERIVSDSSRITA